MKPPIEVRNEITVDADAERVWEVLTEIGDWPAWYRACQWVRVESTPDAERPLSFRWKAHPIELESTVIASVRPHLFAFVTDARGVHADRTFTLRRAPAGRGTLVVSHETQIGWLPWLARRVLAPRLRAANQEMFVDLARTAGSSQAA